jgi:hypothetical protein
MTVVVEHAGMTVVGKLQDDIVVEIVGMTTWS